MTDTTTSNAEKLDLEVRWALQAFAADIVRNTTVVGGEDYWTIDVPVLDINNDFLQFTATIDDNANLTLTDSGHIASLVMLSGGNMRRAEADRLLQGDCYFDDESGAVMCDVAADDYDSAGMHICNMVQTCLMLQGRFLHFHIESDADNDAADDATDIDAIADAAGDE